MAEEFTPRSICVSDSLGRLHAPHVRWRLSTVPTPPPRLLRARLLRGEKNEPLQNLACRQSRERKRSLRVPEFGGKQSLWVSLMDDGRRGLLPLLGCETVHVCQKMERGGRGTCAQCMSLAGKLNSMRERASALAVA